MCNVGTFRWPYCFNYMILRYDCLEELKAEENETQQNTAQFLHDDEAWMPCVKEIHPTWWMFVLVTIYFGDNGLGMMKDPDDCHPRKYSLRNATMWRYALQIMFQTTAGSVIPTDCVYCFIIFPFLTLAEYKMSFLTVAAHSLNLVMLLGDTTLNSLSFPWFRISYFILWTGWAVHVCVSTWWPYPILDLSSPLSPVWYLIVAVLHIPCYSIFALFVNTKYYLLSTWFPGSYRSLR